MGAGVQSIGHIGALLYFLCYTVGIVVMISMILLGFRSDRDYADTTWIVLTVVGIFFFLLAYGIRYFYWPSPGAILAIALLIAGATTGFFVGQLYPNNGGRLFD